MTDRFDIEEEPNLPTHRPGSTPRTPFGHSERYPSADAVRNQLLARLAELKEEILSQKPHVQALEDELFYVRNFRKKLFLRNNLEGLDASQSALRRTIYEITDGDTTFSRNGKDLKRPEWRLLKLLQSEKERFDAGSDIMPIPLRKVTLHDLAASERDLEAPNSLDRPLRKMGLKEHRLHQDKCYQVVVEKLPMLCSMFPVFQSRTGDSDDKATRPKTNLRSGFGVGAQNQGLSMKVRKAEPHQTLVTRLSILDRAVGSSKQELGPNFLLEEGVDYGAEEIVREKAKARDVVKAMDVESVKRWDGQLITKIWASVVQNVSKAARVFQKIETESNFKKIVQQTQKQFKRREAKNNRTAKEGVNRGKRLQKEVLAFWRKRGRELTDLKKKKEKLENEMKKREEEKRETELHKKRLAFIMKQSDIYAHFMAKKLGIHTNSEEAVADPNEMNKVLQDVEIDDQRALENVTDIIIKQRQQMQSFEHHQGSGSTNGHHGGPAGDPQVTSRQEVQQELTADYRPFDFSQIKLEDGAKLVHTPKNFSGSLKEYQLKGLRWLDNLYEQGINGILADEMGLGKTIQAIALLCHITEHKNNWGPFLVVAPASTLHNWVAELKKFCKDIRVLPYWGGTKERKVLRRTFSQSHLGRKESQFHVCVTSYNIAVTDEKIFCRLRWQHVILDEAQQIKNIASQRWKTLMSFKSRNKLLLTGTPLQNSMAELWALLHFIMPLLFDSHEHFQEWFSKDIEASGANKDALNQAQLNRLHAILKPFMLRRVKKDVEREIGQKFEFQIKCELTPRQSALYGSIRNKLSMTDIFQMLENKTKVKNLMNLVMQFRKVCNHPDLFERRQKVSSYVFSARSPQLKCVQPVYGVLKTYSANLVNPIAFELPRLVFHEPVHTEHEGPLSHLWSGVVFRNSTIGRLMGLTTSEWNMHFDTDPLLAFLVVLHANKFFARRQFIGELRAKLMPGQSQMVNELDPQPDDSSSFCSATPDLRIGSCFLYYGYKESPVHGSNFIRPKSMHTLRENLPFRLSTVRCIVEKILAPPIDIVCFDAIFYRQKLRRERSPFLHYALYGTSRRLTANERLVPAYISPKDVEVMYKNRQPSYGLLEKFDPELKEHIGLPSFESLVADSAKLRYLDTLLAQLKREGHRVLIFCQMTKMMNLLEEYLTRRRYSFFRLDGNTGISERNEMVREFQTNNSVFAFILSTRAGGLGITLTAADTVIFYDNDWNPTMDAQATDRAHRIGQMNDVSVYRLISKNTVEERIVKRAQQKQNIQQTVYSGEAFKGDVFKPQDVMGLLFGEDEIDQKQASTFMRTKDGRKKQRKPKKTDESKMDVEEDDGEPEEKPEEVEIEFNMSEEGEDEN